MPSRKLYWEIWGLIGLASASSILAVKLPRWAVLHAGEGLEQTGIGYSLDRRCIWHHDPPCRQYPLEEDCRTAEEGYYCQIWTSIGSWMLRGVAIQVMTFIFLFFLMLARATPRHARKVLFALLLVNCLILLFVLDFFIVIWKGDPQFAVPGWHSGASVRLAIISLMIYLFCIGLMLLEKSVRERWILPPREGYRAAIKDIVDIRY